MLNKSASLNNQDHMLHHVVALHLLVKTQVNHVFKTQACSVRLISTLLLYTEFYKGKLHADSSARLHAFRLSSLHRLFFVLVNLTDLLTDWLGLQQFCLYKYYFTDKEFV